MYPVKLIKVEGDANENKYYNLTPKEDGTFLAEYGRVEGGAGQKKIYPSGDFDRVLRTRIKHGYRDVTELFAEGKKKSLGGIADPEVARLIESLQKYAKATVERSYSISSSAVTKAQIDSAQKILNSLSLEIPTISITTVDVGKINLLLVELYSILPRKMKKVADHLAREGETREEFQKRLIDEQTLLDALSSQVSADSATDSEEDTSKSLLDVLGIKVELTDNKDVEVIKKMMGSKSGQFRKAYRVILTPTERKLKMTLNNSKNKKTELFWHGSRNENWWSILQTGLILRPANAVISGKMFGYGTYFASQFQKSLGYTSLRGSYWSNGQDNVAYLAIFEVHVGKQWKVFEGGKSWEGWMGKLDDRVVSSEGFDSVFAQGGADLRNDEFVVYREDKCSIKYLVEVGS